MRSFGSQWKGRSWAQPPQGGVPFEWGMDALKQYGKELCLTIDEVDLALRLERPASDASWVTAADLGPEALRIAVETMESGRYSTWNMPAMMTAAIHKEGPSSSYKAGRIKCKDS